MEGLGKQKQTKDPTATYKYKKQIKCIGHPNPYVTGDRVHKNDTLT